MEDIEKRKALVGKCFQESGKFGQRFYFVEELSEHTFFDMRVTEVALYDDGGASVAVHVTADSWTLERYRVISRALFLKMMTIASKMCMEVPEFILDCMDNDEEGV